MHGIEVKSHLSSITEEEMLKIEKLIKGVSKSKSMENKKEKNEGPVIIRRAVIINNDKKNVIKFIINNLYRKSKKLYENTNLYFLTKIEMS